MFFFVFYFPLFFSLFSLFSLLSFFFFPSFFLPLYSLYYLLSSFLDSPIPYNIHHTLPKTTYNFIFPVCKRNCIKHPPVCSASGALPVHLITTHLFPLCEVGPIFSSLLLPSMHSAIGFPVRSFLLCYHTSHAAGSMRSLNKFSACDSTIFLLFSSPFSFPFPFCYVCCLLFLFLSP